MITCPRTVANRNCGHGASKADRSRVQMPLRFVVQCRRVGIGGFGTRGTAGTTAAGTAEPTNAALQDCQIPMDRRHCRHPVVVEL